MTFKVTKDPTEVLDYGIDYSRPFNVTTPVDSIASSSWAIVGNNSATDPLVIDDDTQFTANIATVWLSGGKNGYSYNVTNTMVTNSVPPRTYERTVKVRVTEK